MFYQEFNPTSAKAIILIHGLGANSDSWQFQIPDLEKAGYRVIVPDMLGFGKSPYENKKNTIDSMADDVRALMQKLGVEKTSFVGLSMGGAIAMSFALKHPTMTEKLVLANTAARFANKTGGSLYTMLRIIIMRVFPRIVGAKMIAKFIFPHQHQQEFRDEFIREIMMADDRAYFDAVKTLVAHNLENQVSAITAPTLIIGGKHDLVTLNSKQEFLHEAIKGSKLVIIEGAGHVSAVDSAAEFNKEMLDFLES